VELKIARTNAQTNFAGFVKQLRCLSFHHHDAVITARLVSISRVFFACSFEMNPPRLVSSFSESPSTLGENFVLHDSASVARLIPVEASTDPYEAVLRIETLLLSSETFNRLASYSRNDKHRTVVQREDPRGCFRRLVSFSGA